METEKYTDLKKILDSLYILRYITIIIDKYYQAYKLQKDKENIISIGLKCQILILANSFIDEWDKSLKVTDDDKLKQKILELKKKAKPAIDRIKEWDGIKEFRNTVLAHNFRNTKLNNQIVFGNDYTDYLKFPDDISEIRVLIFCIIIASETVCVPFYNELEILKDSYSTINKNVTLRKIDWKKEIHEIKIMIDQQ